MEQSDGVAPLKEENGYYLSIARDSSIGGDVDGLTSNDLTSESQIQSNNSCPSISGIDMTNNFDCNLKANESPTMCPQISHENDPSTTTPKNRDSRFVCSICLETVSDEPVVTRCGHLYCWSCLYQWLEPGMLLNEYFAAFGNPCDDINGVASTSNTFTGDSSSSVGLNFLHGMTYDNTINNASNRRFNPSGGPYNEQRRFCPVCKSDCTVDSVIPVYIHVQSISKSTYTSTKSSSCASFPSSAALPTAHLSDSESGTPKGSPIVNTSSSFDTDPTSNVGLRQRHSSASRVDSRVASVDESIFVSPVQSRHDVENEINSISTNTNSCAGLSDTPVHGNRCRDGNEETGMGNDTNQSSSQVPSRPIPTSPRVANLNVHPPNAAQSVPHHESHRGQYDHQWSSTPRHADVSGLSPPLRHALRPRRQQYEASFSPETNRPYQEASIQRHQGRLTSVLMGIVDTIDNLAAFHHSSANGQQASEQGHAFNVPPLHRSDGGLGGIGRAFEVDQHTRASNSANVITEEEASLELAREFLSRLLLMLACFVVLCLLLF